MKTKVSDKRSYCNFAYSPLGFLQDGNVGIGVFPQGEKVFVRRQRPHAGGIASAPCEVLASSALARATPRPAKLALKHSTENGFVDGHVS